MIFEPLDFARLLVDHENGLLSDPGGDVLLRESLLTRFSNLAVSKTGFDAESALAPADQFPGYLSRDIDGWRVYAPWTLADFLPGQEALDSLLGTAETIAVAPFEAICISGSSAMAGAVLEVGDLDYCQYVDSPPPAIADRIHERLRSEEPAIALRASYGSRYNSCVRAEWPWSEDLHWLKHALETATLDSARRLMTEFLVRHPDWGWLPASNVVLCCSFADRAVGAARYSFVFQEVVALRADTDSLAPHWELTDPRQLAGFLVFLRRQMIEFMETKPLKSMKRLLLLTATMGLRELAQRALDILNKPQSGTYIIDARQRDVIDLAAAIDPAKWASLGISGGAAEGNHVGTEALSEDVKRNSQQLVREVDDMLEELMSAARSERGGS